MGEKRKHLKVKELVSLLGDVNNTMGEDSYLVVVVDGREYPVIGVDTYDAVFCGIRVGKELEQEGIERREDGVYVAV